MLTPAVPHAPGATPEPDVVLVLPAGGSATSLRDTVLAAMTGRPRDVVLDLRAVGSMTHPELAVLIGARARQRARKRRLTLVFDPRSATDDALSRAGLHPSFVTASSIPGADRRDE